LLVALTVGVVVFAARRLPLGESLLALVNWIRAAGAWGLVAYVGLYGALGAVAVPLAVVSGIAGYVYGPVKGLAIAMPGMLLGATAGLAVGRTIARPWVNARFGQRRRWARLNAALERHGLKFVTLLRLTPVLPQNLLHHVLGATRVRTRDFVLGTAVGMAPMTVVHVYVGSVLTSATEILAGGQGAAALRSRWITLGVGTALTIVAIVLLGRMAKRVLARELGPEVDETAPVPPADPAT